MGTEIYREPFQDGPVGEEVLRLMNKAAKNLLLNIEVQANSSKEFVVHYAPNRGLGENQWLLAWWFLRQEMFRIGASESDVYLIRTFVWYNLLAMLEEE